MNTSAAQRRDSGLSPVSAEISRGTRRLIRTLGYSSVCELTLPNGRRADIAAISNAGRVLIVEIKSSVADFRSDSKWREYTNYCDQFFFAVAPEGPIDLIPGDVGLIVADSFFAEVLRASEENAMPSARRRAVLLAFARHAADRLLALQDPSGAERPFKG